MRISDWCSDVCSSDLHRDSTDIEEWLVNTVLRAERIKRAVEMDYFPRTDNGCLTYNRPCEFMDICQTRDREAVMEMLLLGEPPVERSEEHTSELQSLMRISYAVFCLNKKTPKYIS